MLYATLNAVVVQNYAWTIADQLLQMHKDVESCCFAAQTMRVKVIRRM